MKIPKETKDLFGGLTKLLFGSGFYKNGELDQIKKLLSGLIEISLCGMANNFGKKAVYSLIRR